MRLNTRPVLAGVAMGTIALIALVLLPKTAIESLGARTHLADIMDAAKPPLGTKARFLIGLIPFFFASGVGLILGFVMARKPIVDEYGSYADYELGEAPTADPFEPMSFSAPEPAPVVAEMTAPPGRAAAIETPLPSPPAVMPVAPVRQPIEAEANSDLAEIADAIVRLGARLDTIETKLGAAPKTLAPVSGDIADRLARIAASLDAAG